MKKKKTDGNKRGPMMNQRAKREMQLVFRTHKGNAKINVKGILLIAIIITIIVIFE